MASSSDTITLQGIVKDVKGGNAQTTMLSGLASKEISTIKTYNASDVDVLEGPWTYIRVVKTGANGDSLVEGFI